MKSSSRKLELLVETDVLLAVMKVDDPLREYGVKVFGLENLALSPFALVELNFLSRAKKLDIQDFEGFSSALSDLITSKEIRLIADKPGYHRQASLLERQYRLTFFDSLHASVSKIEGETLLSFDKFYDRLASTGVKRVDPRSL